MTNEHRHDAFTTISHYAATFHEDPTRGNGLTLEEAVHYNEWKRRKNRLMEQRPNIKTVEQMHVASHGIAARRKQNGVRRPQR